jgi:predicted esterase
MTALAYARRSLVRAKAAMISFSMAAAPRRKACGAGRGVCTARRGLPRAASARWELVSLLVPCADRSERAAAVARARRAVEKLVEEFDGQGFGAERLALLGFSQGGCLALEFAAPNARRYGAVIGLSAGLIGPEDTPRAYAGSLAGTHVFQAVATSMRIFS